MQVPYTPPQPEIVLNNGMTSAYENFAVDHRDRNRMAAAHESLQAQTAYPSTGFSYPSNSAPFPLQQESQPRDDMYRPQPSTAPVHRQMDPEEDLPPERTLPFCTRRDKDRSSKSTKDRATTEKQAESSYHAAASLSERKPILPRGKHVKSKEQVHAEDIDTQLLLAKVKARKSNSSKDPKNSAVPAVLNPKPHGQETTAFKKPRRNIRCLSCRSKRCKCERNPENPDGTCVPCSAAGRQCSFVPKIEPGLHDLKPKRSNVQVPNSQEETSQVSQPARISLRQRGVPPLSNQVNPVKDNDEANGTKPQQGIKRPSQIAMPAPKRVRRARDDNTTRIEEQADKGNIATDVMAKPAIHEPCAKPRTPLKSLVNPPDTIMSDATTMTATTLDLDPVSVTTLELPKLSLQKVEASLPSNCSEPQSGQNNPQADPPRALPKAAVNITNLKEDPKVFQDNDAQEIFKTLMSSDVRSLLKMSPEEQDSSFDSFFSIALYDDDFLAFLKIMDDRWETGMFEGKI